MTVWTVTIIDDESPIVRIYSTRDKAMAAAIAADSDDVEVIVNEQSVL